MYLYPYTNVLLKSCTVPVTVLFVTVGESFIWDVALSRGVVKYWSTPILGVHCTADNSTTSYMYRYTS